MSLAELTYSSHNTEDCTSTSNCIFSVAGTFSRTLLAQPNKILGMDTLVALQAARADILSPCTSPVGLGMIGTWTEVVDVTLRSAAD
ncbi:hypothetical protein AMS68_003897 [Peltaster fructicola]|uniref:Uncharacterized protein n=1 Tax=Peltaster fructicola TaxID=286661 RepID=A0A6H0XVA7_9PEZI|nr:hypothetical protein AMS68_003897 [Peltaster fructicola]